MALLLLDSFDHYADADKLQKYTQLVAAGGLAGGITVGAFGDRSTNGLKLYTTAGGFSGSGSLHALLGQPAASGATAGFGFRFNPVNTFTDWMQGTDPDQQANIISTCCILACRRYGANLWWLRFNNNGTMSVYRGSTLLGSTSAALIQNAWTYVEVKVLLHASAGTVDVRFGEVSVLSLTGQNTTNTGDVTWDEFKLGPVTCSNANGDLRLDDLQVFDGSGASWFDFVGDINLDPRAVTAAGDDADFNPSAGSNYQNVDESQADGDTTYNEGSSAGDQDTFVVADHSPSGSTIKGIQIVAQVRKTDSGAAIHKALSKISGVVYGGAERSVGTSYQFARECLALSPATAAAWTEAEFNAAKFGYKKSA